MLRGRKRPEAVVVAELVYKASWHGEAALLRQELTSSAVEQTGLHADSRWRSRGTASRLNQPAWRTSLAPATGPRAERNVDIARDTRLGIFSAVALLLTTVGLYGALSYSVTQRRREMAIRVAVGSRPDRIFRIVLGHELRVTVLGLLLGGVGAIGLADLPELFSSG